MGMGVGIRAGHGSCQFGNSVLFFADNDLGNGAITHLDYNGTALPVRLWWHNWNHFSFYVIDLLNKEHGGGKDD